MAEQLNPQAVEFARRLIADGKVVRDEHGDWRAQQPDTEAENTFLKGHSYADYAQWHLGVDPDANPDTKGAYSFPYGNFTEVVRAGLIAAEERAAQYGHHDIEQAAKELIAAIDQS